MRAQKSFLIPVICLFLGFMATSSLAQPAPDNLSVEDLAGWPNLVVTSVSGSGNAFLNQTISVTFEVQNQGSEASGSYKVGLYLSTDNKINPGADRLLANVTFSTGLKPAESRKATAKVLVPINGLLGSYYYGAVVANSKKASLKQVSIARYSLSDDNDTVTDHKTGLVWQKADDGQTRNWSDTYLYCANLVLGGHKDWRLPRIEELQTIVDFSRYNPTIDPLFDCRTTLYWSSSTYARYTDQSWLVSFYDGDSGTYPRTTNLHVRCVRGIPW